MAQHNDTQPSATTEVWKVKICQDNSEPIGIPVGSESSRVRVGVNSVEDREIVKVGFNIKKKQLLILACCYSK